MHLAIQRNIVDDLAAVGFEGCAEVVNVHTRKLGHQPVGASRRNPSHNEVVDPFLPPSRNDVIPLLELLKESGNVIGIVLQIAIHGQNELARGVIESGGKRRGLAKIPAQLHHQHAAVDRGYLFQQLVRPVARSVVHKHQLKRVPHLLHHLLQARI